MVYKHCQLNGIHGIQTLPMVYIANGIQTLPMVYNHWYTMVYKCLYTMVYKHCQWYTNIAN